MGPATGTMEMAMVEILEETAEMEMAATVEMETTEMGMVVILKEQVIVQIKLRLQAHLTQKHLHKLRP